ncbi:unnamed protein product [Dibothriocephalus latus]|uniref:Uncharacterized protein n=1 Tax=Dibothriocephalus latus TaxID=60516 RepID=A0A3P7N1V6_DIBLA|nr:unnamed protein product [Dibothriocephalus latus]
MTVVRVGQYNVNSKMTEVFERKLEKTGRPGVDASRLLKDARPQLIKVPPFDGPKGENLPALGILLCK